MAEVKVHQWECPACGNEFCVESMLLDWVRYCPFCNNADLIENESFIVTSETIEKLRKKNG